MRGPRADQFRRLCVAGQPGVRDGYPREGETEVVIVASRRVAHPLEIVARKAALWAGDSQKCDPFHDNRLVAGGAQGEGVFSLNTVRVRATSRFLASLTALPDRLGPVPVARPQAQRRECRTGAEARPGPM